MGISVEALAARAAAPMTEGEIDEVLAGVRTAMLAVAHPGWSPAQVRTLAAVALAHPEGCGEALSSEVHDAATSVAMLVVGLRLLRAVAPESVMWPPETSIAPVLAPGPSRVQ